MDVIIFPQPDLDWNWWFSFELLCNFRFSFESENLRSLCWYLEKTQSSSTRPTARITICEYYINHNKVWIYCALLTPQWKQSFRSASVQVGDTWCLTCSIIRLDSQNRKFALILIITEAKNAHFFVCKRTGFVHKGLSDFVKLFWLESRVINCDSSRVIPWKYESSHHFF